MTLEQLQFVLQVKNSGTISAAAEKLNISHTSVSRAITNLESELGVNVFIRDRKGTRLTPEGELVVESAQRISDELSRLKDSIDAINANTIISLLVFPLDAMFFLPDVVSTLQAGDKRIFISLEQAGVSEIFVKIRARQADFGIAALSEALQEALPDDIVATRLIESEFCVCCAPSSPLAGLEYTTIEEVGKYPLILHNDVATNNSHKSLFGDISKLNVLMYSNSNSFIKQIVSEGSAVCIFTRFLGVSDTRIRSGGLVLVPLVTLEDGEPKRQPIDFMLLRSKNKQVSAAEKRFIAELKRSVKKWT